MQEAFLKTESLPAFSSTYFTETIKELKKQDLIPLFTVCGWTLYIHVNDTAVPSTAVLPMGSRVFSMFSAC